MCALFGLCSQRGKVTRFSWVPHHVFVFYPADILALCMLLAKCAIR
jgi:hypothetical protein